MRLPRWDIDRRARPMIVGFGLLLLPLIAPPTLAQETGPEAIVEDLIGQVAGVEVFDYLNKGRKLTLPADATITLGYLRSCVREILRGGSVVIGESESTVADGASVERTKPACDGARLVLTAEQAGKSGTMVFRAPTDASGRKIMPEPDLILHGRSPLVDAAGAATLIIERLDVDGERWQIDLSAQAKLNGRMFDCAQAGISLSPSGFYRVATDKKGIIVRVHPFAAAGSGPAVSRLIRL